MNQSHHLLFQFYRLTLAPQAQLNFSPKSHFSFVWGWGWLELGMGSKALRDVVNCMVQQIRLHLTAGNGKSSFSDLIEKLRGSPRLIWQFHGHWHANSFYLLSLILDSIMKANWCLQSLHTCSRHLEGEGSEGEKVLTSLGEVSQKLLQMTSA